MTKYYVSYFYKVHYAETECFCNNIEGIDIDTGQLSTSKICSSIDCVTMGDWRGYTVETEKRITEENINNFFALKAIDDVKSKFDLKPSDTIKRVINTIDLTIMGIIKLEEEDE